LKNRALVSGLVCLELLKIAAERIRQRMKATKSSQFPDNLHPTIDEENIISLFRNSYVNLVIHQNKYYSKILKIVI
jgi:hypothetical protein